MSEFKECFYCKGRFPGPFFTKHLKECKSRKQGNNNSSNNGTWKCNMCSYKNNSTAQSCMMCQQSRKPSPNNSSNNVNSNSWKCPSCTYINTASLKQCKICSSNKPAIKPQPMGRGIPPNMYRGGPPPIYNNNNNGRGNGPPPNIYKGGPPPNMYRGRGGPMPPNYRGGPIPPNMYRGRGGPPPNMYRGRGGPMPPNMYRGRGGPPPMFRGRGMNPNMRGGMPPMRGRGGGPSPNMNGGGLNGLPPPSYSDDDNNDDDNSDNDNNNNGDKDEEKELPIENDNDNNNNNNNKGVIGDIDPELLKNMGISIENADPDTLQLIVQMLQAELCGKCKKNQGFDLPCSHKLCGNCAKGFLLKGIVSQKWKKEPLICPINGCKSVMPEWIIKRCGLGEQYQKQVEEMQRTFLLASDKTMTQCPKCSEVYSAEAGDKAALNVKEKGLDGKLLNDAAKADKLVNRFRCHKCTTIFCKSCKVTPYHLGYTCATWKKYKESKKCRFCEESLTAKNMPEYDEDDDDLGPGLQGNVCNQKACQDKKIWSCDKKHKDCGHNCIGLRGRDCLKCINPKCVKKGDLNDDEYCNICWVDPLFACPTIKLKCNHYFHFKCVWDKIERKWPAARITFGFLNCPLCKQSIHDDSLTDLTAQYYKLKDQIQKDAVERLKIEGLDKDKRITDPNSPYYNNVAKFAMDRLAFYKCFKCKKPYFGGMKACEEAGLEQEEKYVQEHLVCGSCASGPNTKSCKKHGKKYITYKCKFCCSISQWYCWGSTHFCDSCHKKQEKGDYLNRKPISELPKCPGVDKCPLGIEHPPNGAAEFSLGCVVCLRK